MVLAASLTILDWYLCVTNSGGATCRQIRTEAAMALSGAANAALGVALQTNP